MGDRRRPLLVICGPTGSGKTALALELAGHFPLEIISADSRQVYRQMDIGTAKATPEEQALVPHHLIDLIDPDQEFSVAEFVELARPLIAEIDQRGHLPCVVGGTGLYIRALLGGLAEVPAADPEVRRRLQVREESGGPGTLHRALRAIDPAAAGQIHPHNIKRLVRALEIYTLTGRRMSDLHADHRFADEPFRTLQIAPDSERAELFRRIDLRAEQMLKDGLVLEVERLIERYSPALKALQTLGYREVLEFWGGQIPAALMLEKIRLHTRQYAKRQLTWFRKNREIIWVDSSTESGRVLQSIENLIQR
jgi:tRNA dimethylallyltransferase